ncbi:MAG: homogentisate 1,2-dioxygenase [Flavobacteriaceae bacterium]
MPIYHQLGTLPHKRHVVFPKPQGGMYSEQLFGTIGFDGMSTNMYHIHRPTQVKAVGDPIDIRPQIARSNNMESLQLKGFQLQPEADYLQSRVCVLTNTDCDIELAAPTNSMHEYFYKNADSDEVLFVHQGKGVLRTQLGNLVFSEGDYLVIPRGMIYQLRLESSSNRLFIVSSKHPVYTPKRYRNHFGQMMEHAPFCERDIRRPDSLESHDQKGDFPIKIRKQNELIEVVYAYHPFDVVGYDGHNYPWAFSIHDFEPITGRIHQPPPVHQTFESAGFVICSFVPRLYDYHPEAIPAPYNHSNIDSDEVLYYVDGDFMSRNDIQKGDITLHPAGIPHGPHPGAAERSIGKKATAELAVMVDTFAPLQVTQAALELSDTNYLTSWLD